MVHRRALRGHHRAAAARLPPGTTSSRTDRSATTSGSRPTAEPKRRDAVSTCSSIVGGHAGDGPKIGDVDFGPDVAVRRRRRPRWVVRLPVQGRAERVRGKPVKIFVMGANQWREEDDWPLARAAGHEVFPALGTARRTRCAGTARCPRRRLARRRRRISTSTIRRTPRRPSADRCAATASTCIRVRAISVRSKRETMCWCTRRRRSTADLEVTGPVTLELYASPRRWTRTSRRSSWTWGRTASRRT